MTSELFRITISFSSKWEIGYMKAISCGYMESSGIWGYHQRFEDQVGRGRVFDSRSPHKKKKLKIEVAEEILKEIANITLSLSGPEKPIDFSPVFYCISLTRNETSIDFRWNGSTDAYYEKLNALWQMIDDAVYFPDEPKSSSVYDKLDLPRFRALSEQDEK